MALSIGNKSIRVLRFLQGVRHPEAFSIMAAHGFHEQELQQGWQLLMAFSDARFDEPLPAERGPRAAQQIDAFENTWFPIVKASLGRHHPELAEEIFLNLSQRSDSQVAFTLGALLSRIRELEAAQGEGAGAKERRAARRLLEHRGFTDAVLREGERLVALMSQALPGPAPGNTRHRAREAADALWAWYLEWSSIARTVIKERKLLRQMGFLQSGKAHAGERQGKTTKVAIVSSENSVGTG